MKLPPLKRTTDLALAVLGVPVAVPICAAAAIAIRLETDGSPVFVQQRVGVRQQPINVIKLRTMYQETGDLPSHEVSTAKVTKVGKFLRKTKIDELPQLWNVLRGEMSFVGPRPCLPSQTEVISERASRGVYSVVPGITGPSQLAGIDMSTPVELAESDASYVENQSPREDFSFIVLSALGRGSGDAAGKAAEPALTQQ